MDLSQPSILCCILHCQLGTLQWVPLGRTAAHCSEILLYRFLSIWCNSGIFMERIFCFGWHRIKYYTRLKPKTEPGYIHCIRYRIWGKRRRRALHIQIHGQFQRYFSILKTHGQWGARTHDEAKDGAPIDQTERRHDVTLISVDVESQENLCTIFYRFWQRKTLSMWASCGIFIEITDEILRTLHWCTKSFQILRE
jgi:hypothetical protein